MSTRDNPRNSRVGGKEDAGGSADQGATRAVVYANRGQPPSGPGRRGPWGRAGGMSSSRRETPEGGTPGGTQQGNQPHSPLHRDRER